MSKRIPLGGVLVPTELLPDNRLAMPNPELVQAMRYGGAGAAAALPDVIMGSHVHPKDPRWTLVPRGALDALGIEHVTNRDDVPAVQDHMLLPPEISFGATLRSYQELAVGKAILVPHGAIVMPPGAGKTVTGLALVCRLGLRVLAIVHTKDLMQQWIESSEKFLGHPLDQVGGGKTTTGSPVGTVAMIQTLATWRRREIEALSMRHGMLLWDEIHHLPSDSFRRVSWHLGCPRRYGLTATPVRADGLMPMMLWAMGPVIHTVTNKDLVEAGVAVLPIVQGIESNFTYGLRKQLRAQGNFSRYGRRLKAESYDDMQKLAASIGVMCSKGARVTVTGMLDDDCKEVRAELKRIGPGIRCETQVDTSSLAACYRAMISDTDRLDLIRHAVTDMLKQDRKVMVLAGRVNHCQWIADVLATVDVPSVVLTGKMTSKKRKAGLDAFKDSEVMVCIATTLADEGLDVPDITGMVMAFPGRSDAKTTQRVGRSMRNLPGKAKPLVVDIVDHRLGLFKNQWTARRKSYRLAGCELK